MKNSYVNWIKDFLSHKISQETKILSKAGLPLRNGNNKLNKQTSVCQSVFTRQSRAKGEL